MNNPQKETLSLPRRIFSAIKQWVHIPVNMIIVFCLVAGSLYMQIVAHQHEVNRGLILVFCAAFSVASVLLYSWEHTFIVELTMGVAGGVVGLLAFNTVEGSVRAYLANILYCYGVIGSRFRFMDKDDNATLCFILLALIASMLTAAYLMRSGPVLMALVFPAVSLVLTTMRYWDLCDPKVVLAVLCAVVIVVLTHRVRRADTAAAGKQSLVVSVPVIAVLILLALLVRPEGYTLPEWGQRAREHSDSVLTSVFGIVQKPQEDQYKGSAEVYRVKINVDELGPRVDDERQVMEVYSEDSRYIYLRAFSYMRYSEGTWRHETAAQAKEFSGILPNPLNVPENERNANKTGRVKIKTDEVNTMIFLPYTAAQIPEGGSCYGDSYIRNEGNIKEYSVTYGRISAVNRHKNSEYINLVYEHYRDIPEDTAEKLRAIAVENGIITEKEANRGYPENVPEAVDSVVELVKNCAEYDVSPTPMPEGKDFPVWFLTEAEKGYCSHFASTATLMLRAVGVPARLTSGFVVRTEPGEWVKVLGEDQYVWVEYYDAKTGGWIIVEPTPEQKPVVSIGDAMGSPASDTDSQIVSSGTDIAVVSDTDAELSPAVPVTTVTTATVTTDASEVTAATTTVAATTTTATTVPAATTAAQETIATSATEHSGSSAEGQQENDSGKGSVVGTAILFAIPVLLVLAGLSLLLVRRCVTAKRQRGMTVGTNKERAVAMGEYLEVLKDAGGGSWDTRTREILLKAQFSQHELTDSELEQVKESVAQSVEAVKVAGSPLTDLINRFIRFIY